MAVERTFIHDAEGRRIAVFLPIEEYERLVEDSEDPEDVQDYYAAKASGEQPVPFKRRTPQTQESGLMRTTGETLG